MEIVIRCVKSLRRAARLYCVAALAGAALVFIGVEGWRVIAWSLTPDLGGSSADGGLGRDLTVAVPYFAIAAVYVWTAKTSRGHGAEAALYALPGFLHVVGGTVAVYGLFAVTEGLIPSLSRYDLLSATGISMSVLLGAYMLFHGRVIR
ncbi:MAG: hypothetical protein EXR07_12180 [Acetobacteraceae bacterium]|nr:hypothetical protein [Acetobacteraceae bacterium]